MDFFGISVVSFIFAMGLIVGIHEYGHYITARLLKIKVLEFSIGFGPTIFNRVSKKTNINYKLSLLPLGGYVKMLNKSEVDELSDYTKEDVERAFDNAPLWKRFLVVFNGPLANFILAFFIYFSISIGGVDIANPVVGQVSGKAQEIGIKHGDVFKSIGDDVTVSWEDVALSLAINSGEKEVDVKVVRDNKVISLTVDFTDFSLVRGDTDILAKMGILPAQMFAKNIVNKVEPDSPAHNSGLQINDLIIEFNGQEVSHFIELSKLIKVMPGENVSFTVVRDSQELVLTATLDGVKGETSGGKYGFSPKFPTYNHEWYTKKELSIVESAVYGFEKTVSTTSATLTFIGKLISGDIALDNISGPVGIAKATGQGASMGMTQFLGIVAFLSLNIMVINLLPIPALDGGHLFTYMIESVFGPVPEKFQVGAQYVGMFLMLSLMAYAIGLDFMDFFN